MKKFIKKHIPQRIKSKLKPAVNYYRTQKRAFIRKRALKTVLMKSIERSKSKSSISDDGYYPLVCYLASKHDSIFEDFRRNIIYDGIVGTPEVMGRRFFDLIAKIKNFHLIPEDWKNFRRNDLYGNPQMYTFIIDGEKIDISPNTVRYVKVLGDIMTMFNNVQDIKSIAEIGVGFGGQCRIILSKLPKVTYTLIDLPEVLGLAERYLNNYDECKNNVRYVDGGHIYSDDNYDLVISEYAFSELRRDVQDMYFEKVILKSKRGYITCNNGPVKSFGGGYLIPEILERIPGSRKIEVRDVYKWTATGLIVWENL